MWYLTVFRYSKGYPRWQPDDLCLTIFQPFKCIIIKICILWIWRWHIDTHVSEMHTYFTLVTCPSTRQYFGSRSVHLIFMFDVIRMFKCNIGGCHVQAVSHWLLITWSSIAVSEQVQTSFGLFVRKPRCACRWRGGSLWRSSSSVPSTCLPWLKRVKLSWRRHKTPNSQMYYTDVEFLNDQDYTLHNADS